MNYTFTFPYSKLEMKISNTSINPDLSGGSSISQGKIVTLKISDIPGIEVATLVKEQLQQGIYEVTFDGSNLPSGIYFYKLTAGEFIKTNKMILLK
jgi:hypothetical protein